MPSFCRPHYAPCLPGLPVIGYRAKVLHPGERLTALKVAEVRVVRICFLLEADVEICFPMISIFEEVDHVMQKVDDVERQNKQFLLLPEMDAFMVNDDRICHQAFVSKKHKGVQGHRIGG